MARRKQQAGLGFLVIACLLVFSGSVHAQVETSVAVLPVQSAQRLGVLEDKEIVQALTAPLAEREDYTIVPPRVAAVRLGIITQAITDPAFMQKAGERLDVKQVVACRLSSSAASREDRKNYRYSLAYYDVDGRAMMAMSEGQCSICSPPELGRKIALETKRLYAGPYPLGLDTEPSGAVVYNKGESWGQTPIRRPLPEGSYKVVLARDGYKRMEVEFPMPGDRPLYATLPLEKDPNWTGPIPVAVAPVSPAETAPTQPMEANAPPSGESPAFEATRPSEVSRVEEAMSPQRAWGWRSIGLSAATFAGGLGLTLASLHADDKASDTRLLSDTRQGYADRRDGYAIGSYVMYGLAGAALTTGLVLILTDQPPDSARVSIAPVLAPDGAGVQALVRY